MNTTFLKSAACTVSTCVKENMKKVPFFIISFFIVIGSSIPIQAGLLDDVSEKVDTVSTNVNTVKRKVNNIQLKVKDIQTQVIALPNEIEDQLRKLPGTIQTELDITLDPELVKKVKEAIEEVRVVVEEQSKAIADFDDNECAIFKTSLISMFTNLGELASSVSSLGLPNPPEFIPLPNNPINDIPCKVLVGPSLVLGDKLEEIGEKLIEMNGAIQVFLPLFIGQVEDLSTLKPGEVINTKFCEVVVLPKRNEIDNAAKAIQAASILLQVVASRIDTKTFTGALDIGKLKPEAKEADVGIWGWAHITVQKQSARHKFANGINSVVKLMDKIQSKASNINNNCISTYNQSILDVQQDKILRKQNVILRLLTQLSHINPGSF